MNVFSSEVYDRQVYTSIMIMQFIKQMPLEGIYITRLPKGNLVFCEYGYKIITKQSCKIAKDVI